MKQKKVPYGTKLPVRLTLRERDVIRDHTFYDPAFANLALADGAGIRVDLSLDDIEEMQGYVAAEANHCDDPNLENELDALFGKLQEFLESYDDQKE